MTENVNFRGVVAHFQQGLITIGITVLLGLGGCDSNNESAGGDDRPNVVATSTIIADWTKEIAGDEVNLTGILDPGADPHVYEPVPADSQAFEDAALILYNGYNLEPGLIRIMNAAGVNATKFAVGEVVEPLDYEYSGQIKPDPHVWGDIENAIAMVNAIRDQLIAVSPEDAGLFTQNAERYIAELTQLNEWIEGAIATIPPSQRKLVTTHDAFQYYANAYGLEIPGTLIGISTEEQPSARTVQQLIEAVKSAKIPAIFAETTLNPALIQTVAEEANVTLAEQELYSDSIGAMGSDGDSYLKMMESNTRTIVKALGGEIIQ